MRFFSRKKKKVLYNKYINETTYPQLDLRFEGDKAKLYNVNLYDGNEKIYWAKKIVPGTALSNEFLSSGPYGAFNLAGIYKSDTSDYNYTFTGNWKVYTNEDFSDESPLLISDLLDLGAINNDVYLVPQFTQEIRTYKLEFYGEDHETPLFTHESVPAGTLYKDIPQLDIPVKILPEGTPLKAGYDFIGYALIADSLTPVSGEYKVRNDQKFYAIFEQITDITERVHPEWFNYDNGRITPKVRLKGKITIPSTYTDEDGKIVNITRLGEFNTQGCQITHVFCAPNSKLTTIDREAFYSSVYLEYFDFSQNTVTNIGQWAFRNCMKLRPDLLQLSNKLISVGEYAFTGAFEALSNVTLVIPASVQTIGNRGFGNLNIGENSTIQVGEIDAEGNIIYSNLNLANGTSSATELEKFSQNTKNIATFKFYSKLYDSFESPIKTFGQVYNAFIRDFSGTTLNATVSQAINSSAEFATLMSEHGELYQIKNEDDNNYNLIFELATQYPDDGMPHYYYYNRDFDYYDNIATDEAFAAIAASGKELFIIDLYNRFASDGGQIVGDRRIRFAEVPKENGIYVRQPNKTVYYFDKDPSLQDDFAMAGYTLEFYKEGN